MIDPEIEYRRIVSGDAARVRSCAEALLDVLHDLRDVRQDLAAAARVPVWTGAAALAFAGRAVMLQQGLTLSRSAIGTARDSLVFAADCQDSAVDLADYAIGFWRNRPPALPLPIEVVLAHVVNGFLLAVARTYNTQLAAIAAGLTGGEVDLEQLDSETRAWVEEGLRKNGEWLRGDRGLGPLIPNTKATGDGRGWIPQGLGYDPSDYTYLQAYYTKDEEGHGDASYLALIDEFTGREKGEVVLGPHSDSGRIPTHAGGVAVNGGQVYVVDNGEVYTYSLADIRNAPAGATVPQSQPPQTGLKGGSYSAFKDGKLYLGDHENDLLHVYASVGGEWVLVDTVKTPNNCQGVLVRDGEYVFSASSGRHEDHSQLYVQDFDGNRSDPYDLPSMSQGVVEVDGQLVTSHESGAEEFDHPLAGTAGWWWGRDDYQDLWANPYLTTVPLGELGLQGDVSVVPQTLVEGANELLGAGDGLRSAGSAVRSVELGAEVFGEVANAARVASVIDKLLDAAGASLRQGARTVGAVSQLLRSSAIDYSGSDDHVQRRFDRFDLPDRGQR